MKKGDKVKHRLLGIGVVTGGPFGNLIEVKFNEKPPLAYNMGVNPCLVLTKDLNMIDTTIDDYYDLLENGVRS